MPQTIVTADVFGAVTISLVALSALLGLLCICRCVYFQLQIRRRDFSFLRYFNGPWTVRIAIVILSIWWGFGEIVRLTFLRGTGKPFSTLRWQKYGCEFYVLSNLGFAEPSIFLALAFLLNAALRRRESGTRKTFSCVLLVCLPFFLLQLALVLSGPKFSARKKMAKFFSSSSMVNNRNVCAYPLLSTAILGLLYFLVICYVVYVGTRLLSLVINKGLRRRVYLLALSIVFLLPLRVIFLGFSVLARAGNLAHEALIFFAFFALLICDVTGICMLVYMPVADSLALREVEQGIGGEMGGAPYDDYFHEEDSLMANRSRNSDASTKRGSISFRTMIREDAGECRPGGIGPPLQFVALGEAAAC